MALRSVVLALAVLAIIWAVSAGTTAQPAEKEVDPTELLRVGYLNHFMTINGDADLSQIKLAPKVRKSADLIPIVIIPSLFGNKFEIKLVNRSSHWFCASNSDWYTLWFPNVETVFLPLAATCWLDNLSLDYNTSTHMSSWPQGVFWRVPDYGGVDSITYLDDAHQVGGWNVTVALLKQAGYKPGKNLRAAPYDWRISPYQYKDDFVRLKSLIEDTYTMNGNKSVALASLSMGGSYTMLFLNTFVSQTWKDKYIHSWTSFCGPFGGSPWMLAALASTYNVYTIPWFVLPVYTIREVVQSFGAAYWLLPFDQVYGDMPIALTPGMNYTAADFALMFEKTGNQNGVDLYSHMQFARTMQAPGVTTYCIHGYNLSTPHQLQYNGNDLYLAQMNFIYGDGDGTVPITGLNYCDTWQQEQPQPVKSFAIANMLHGTSVKNAQAIEIFMNVLGLEVDGNVK